MTHLRIDMSENDSSHIDMVADSVGSDTCHYSWVVRVVYCLFTKLGDLLGIGGTIHIGPEVKCRPYAGFFRKFIT